MHKSSKAKLGHTIKKDVTASTCKMDQSFNGLDEATVEKGNWMMEHKRYHQFMKAAATSKTTIKPHSLAPTKNATSITFCKSRCSIQDKSCSTNVCSCRRHGLSFVSACGNCIRVESENADHEDVSSDKKGLELTRKWIEIYL
ncbi:unnamed protein product [Lepeophtheirus salmonis]|uniref:(salmon louse) hypothetical protein n=1 Tax=Lepeophtheirus salmonis TaxID=72036 RepID=A0A817FEJ7_LEPSM|nr:unnamed protein product [Lepeophtheirus salmonis]CAG9477738.1 unnamed protein product [Lepeophtheirus salmonis]